VVINCVEICRDRERERELCPALPLSQRFVGQYPVQIENNFTFQTAAEAECIITELIGT
jgi:hypothetical protein